MYCRPQYFHYVYVLFVIALLFNLHLLISVDKIAKSITSLRGVAVQDILALS